jgi:hypothetical protein
VPPPRYIAIAFFANVIHPMLRHTTLLVGPFVHLVLKVETPDENYQIY